MTEIATLPGFSIALPVVVLFGSLVVSRILKISRLGTLIAASSALALPFIDLPLVKEFTHDHPEYLIGSAWAIMLALAIGWVIVRPIISGAVASLGIVKFVYLSILGLALAVTTLLMVNPETLSRYVPGWRGTAGFVLLSASLLSMSLSLARVLRAAVFFVVWSFVSIVLASEVLLHKLPQHLVREDLKKLQSFIPSQSLSEALEKIDVSASAKSGGVRAFVLGGSHALGFPFPEEHGLSSRISGFFEKNGYNVSVQDASLQGASIYDIRRLVSEKIEPVKPEVVFVIGWASDKIRGVNSLGVPGLTESEALEMRRINEDGTDISRLLEKARTAVTSSKLYLYLSGVHIDPAMQSPRVPVQEYREQLTETVRALRNVGTTVVLVSEPVVGEDDKPYRDAMVEAAVSEQAIFVPADRLVTRSEDPRVFGRGTLLSPKGMDLVAQGAVELLTGAQHGLVVPNRESNPSV